MSPRVRGGTKRKRKPGRPEYQPTAKQREQVLGDAGVGIPHLAIAARLGISKMTLRKHFVEELQQGQDLANAKVGGFLFQKATGQKGDDHSAVVAAIFWLKARAGWKDRQSVVIQNPDGTALFEDWSTDKLLPVMERAVEVLRFQTKAGGKKAAAG